MDNNKEMIEGLVSQILDDYHDDKIINQQALFSQPDKEAVCDLLSKLIKIMYPGYFKGTSFRYYNLDSQIAVLLEDIMYNLRKQVVLALPQNPKYRSLSHHELVNMSGKISNDFFKRIPKIRALVETDVAAIAAEEASADEQEPQAEPDIPPLRPGERRMRIIRLHPSLLEMCGKSWPSSGCSPAA